MIGGAGGIRNMWPQPYTRTVWNAHGKDALEDRPHDRCAPEPSTSKSSSRRLQREIATDWIAAYKKYFGTDQSR